MRDLRLVLWIQALRAGVYGFGSVVLGTALARAGRTFAEVGLVFAAMLAGFAVSSIVVGVLGDRLGRRRLYRGLFLVMAVGGTGFALTDNLLLLVLASLTGTVSTDAGESGPITSIEQAMIPHTAETQAGRNRAFGRYNATAYLAGSLGALLAGGPALLREAIPSLPANQRFLLAYPVVAVACWALARRLSEGVEAGVELDHSLRPPPRVGGLAALFALDSFGGGFVVQSFLSFWFARRFGTSVEVLGLVFFATGLLQAGSSLVAGRLANRFGLLRTMVFTHLPSNLLLAAIPLAGSAGWAVGLLLARSSLSQMDVPTRQAYVMAIVRPGERIGAASFTNTARYVSRPFGAAAAGPLAQAALGSPFVAAGAVKVVYDLILLATFRRIPVPKDPEAVTDSGP